jgi:hypothetical protein
MPVSRSAKDGPFCWSGERLRAGEIFAAAIGNVRFSAFATELLRRGRTPLRAIRYHNAVQQLCTGFRSYFCV